MCRLQKSQHSQDKNLTLISQEKLAGIKLRLALLYLADMFINHFKTKLNVFVFAEEFQIEKVFTILLEESFIYWQENMTAIRSVGHQPLVIGINK